MRFFICIAIMMTLLFVSGGDAIAQRDNGISSSKTYNKAGCEEIRNATNKKGMLDEFVMGGGSVCPCAPKPSLWVERIISCFAAAPGGIIYESVKALLDSSSPYKTFYNTLVGGTILFAVVLFGLNMVMGSIQSLPKESFTLILKIGGVLLFFSNYLEVYGYALDIIQGLSKIIGDAAGNIGNICETQTTLGKTPTLWARWDCLFQKFTGLVGGYMAIGILAFATAAVFSGGIGVAMFIGFGYVIMTILLISMRLVYTYLVAIMAVSFLFLLAPIFVPMIFFGQTYNKFTTWFKIIIIYMLQPMLLSLFMVLMLTALEFAIFVGPTSIMSAVSNNDISESISFSEAMSGNTAKTSVTNTDSLDNVITAVTGSTDWSSYVKRMPIFKFIEHTDSGVNTTNQSQSDAVNPVGTDTGISGNQPTTATNSQGANAAGSYKGGVLVPKIDFDGMFSYLKARGKALSKDEWLKNILLNILSSAVLVFILYNLVHALPQITHDLVSQNFGSAFGGSTKARMIGESEIRKSMEAGKEAMRRSAETGDVGGSVLSVAKEGFNSAVGIRPGGAG